MLMVLAMALLGMPPAARSAATDWMDIEGRIQYAYYTEDLHALQRLSGSLASGADSPALRGYYAALADWRLALLAESSDAGQARTAVQQCVGHIDAALHARADFADALALQSVCLRREARMQPLRAPFALARSGRQMSKALHLAPHNPRVLLLNALQEYQLAGPGSAARALAALNQDVAAFEAERRGVEPVPGWGIADAYEAVARVCFDKGDVLQAREALERALLIAPEFALAHRLLKRIISG